MIPHLIDIRNLVFSYPQQFADASCWRLVVKQFAIPRQAVCRVIGGNMTGKTTLLRIIAGLEKLSLQADTEISGSLLSENLKKMGHGFNLKLRETFFLSHGDRMFPELTIWENVRLAKNSGVAKRSDPKYRFKRYMSGLKILQGKADGIQLGTLSSGGQALIRLARAYTWGAQLILIDEVTAHLDDDSAKAFFEHLKILVQEGCSVVLVSHDRRDHELAMQLTTGDIRSTAVSILLKDNTSWVTELSS